MIGKRNDLADVDMVERTALIVVAVVAGPFSFAAGQEGADAGAWPQWRGPAGLGVTADSDLPVQWGPGSENVRWVTTIPGEGASSPIVSNGHVIVTTAYESTTAATWHRAVAGAAVVLTGLFAAMAGLSLWRRRQEAVQGGPASDGSTWPRTLGIVMTVVTTAVFLSLALLVTVGPDRGEFALRKLGSAFAACGLADVEHLVSMKEGVLAAIWLTSGGIALLGLSVAAGYLRAGSFWRVLGVAAVALGAWPLVNGCPLDQWTEKVEFYERLLFVLPGALVAVWRLLACFDVASPARGGPSGERAAASKQGRGGAVEIRWKRGRFWRAGGLGQIGSAVTLVALAALVFWPANFVQSQTGMQRAVVCLDQGTGEILWCTAVATATTERIHSDNTYATPTPATDGEHIVVSFGFAVACLDFQGNILWKNIDQGYIADSRYGSSSSPVIVDGLVITLDVKEFGTPRPGALRAYDVESGQVRWEIAPEGLIDSYVTPLVYHGGGKTQLVIAAQYLLASYDAADGTALWTCKIPHQQVVGSPTRAGELVCIGGATHGPKMLLMMRLDAEDATKPPGVLWEATDGACESASPVLYAGKLYSLADRGVVACYNALDGMLLWRERLRTGRHLASLVAGDGKVYACSTKGATTVLAADAEFKVLAQNELNGRCLASPAVADGNILLRIADRLYCVDAESGP